MSEPRGTVVPFAGFNAQADAAALHKALDHLIGCDEKAIITILAQRTVSQRLEISTAFKGAYGQDLIAHLAKKLGGNFESVVLAMMQPRYDLEAQALRAAMKGAGTDESVLIELICTKFNAEMAGLKEAYTRVFKRDLEKDVVDETSGTLKHLLVSIIAGARPGNGPLDAAAAQADAKALLAAGEGRWGTDESKFNEILIARPFSQLRAIFYEYEKIAGHSIQVTIDKEMGGVAKAAFSAVVQSMVDRPAYFADRIAGALKGAGTDDTTLIRVVVTRSEVDMVDIKAEYEKRHGSSLSKAIQGDCSGDYKRMLIALTD